MTPCTGPSALDAAIMAFKDDPRSCAHDDCPCCHAAFDLVAMLRASAPVAAPDPGFAALLNRFEEVTWKDGYYRVPRGGGWHVRSGPSAAARIAVEAAHRAEVERLTRERDETWRALAESGSLVEWTRAAIDGEPISDFAMSFKSVMDAFDLRNGALAWEEEAAALRTERDALASRLAEVERELSEARAEP